MSSKYHEPVDQKFVYEMNNLAYDLDNRFNPDIQKPSTVGFVLLIFNLQSKEFGLLKAEEPREGTPEHLAWQAQMEKLHRDGRVNYISNANRDDVKIALKELLGRWDT